jgi:hypothetical protein
MDTGATSLDLIVLSITEIAARCRLLETRDPITLRAKGVWEVAPGEIVTVQPRKRWVYAKHPYLSGEITASRIDVPALGLTPLRLDDQGEWDPDEEYWGEESEPSPSTLCPSSRTGRGASTRWSKSCPATIRVTTCQRLAQLSWTERG